MPEFPITPAKRAARLIAPIGVASALLAGGFVLANAAAAAATAPLVTLSMPAQLSNDTGPQPGHLTIDNGATGSAAITGTTWHTTFTVPTGLSCANITVKVGSAPSVVAAGAGSTCTVDAPVSVPAGSTVTTDFTVAVDGSTSGTPITGTITTVSQLTTTAGTLATSNTTTTALINPTAPAFNAAPPAPIVHLEYIYPLVKDPGLSKTKTTYTVDRVADGSTTVSPVSPSTDPVTHDIVYSLADRDETFIFDATTGYLTASASTLDQTDSKPGYTYLVIANNGVGGAAAPSSGIAVHDVLSAAFQLPVLFSDVATTSQFGPVIYTLADAQIIGGYADGTFRGAGSVSRQAFAHFIAGYLGYDTGACSGTSGFSDVPASSPFCKDIAALSSAGIVNGYSNGTFHPGATISRQAIAAFLYRTDAVHRKVPPTEIGDATCSTQPFPDVSLANPFCGDIAWLTSHSIATGYSDGGFHPAGNSSRQATASFIAKLGSYEKHTF